jgi:fructan beta-fructosidase
MRLAFHYAPAANWLSDPNGLVYQDGVWHLCYQHNPHGDLWGHMAWGHATSRDLIAWTEQPPVLLEDERHLIFSGSAVVDTLDSAGFGAGALVAIYTGADRDPQGLQVQCLAFSTNQGANWTKYDGNPVLDLNRLDFRDPNVIWHDATKRWIMTVVLATENRALFFASPDLKRWAQIDALSEVSVPGDLWECPMLIALPVEGTDQQRWVFKVDVMRDGPGSGAIGIIGDFDGHRFSPDRGFDGTVRWHILDHGRDFYAAIGWHLPRDAYGRPAWIGWMGNHHYQADLPSRGWRGAMSVPRRLSLIRTDGGYRIRQMIEPALAARFGPGIATNTIMGGARIDITQPSNAELMMIVISDKAGRSLAITFSRGRVIIERSAGFSDLFDAPVEVSMPYDDLILWFDRTSIELQDTEGLQWVSLQHCLADGEYAVRASAALALRIAPYIA